MRSSLKVSLAVLALAALSLPGAVAAQDISACEEIVPLARDGAIADALWELGACENVLQTLFYDGLVSALSVEIEGLAPSGGEVEGAMGINMVTIMHGPIKTEFTSGTGAAENPMAGLGAIAALGNAFGVREAGVEEVRLGRRLTGRLEEKSDGSFSLTVTIEEGLLVQEGPDSDQLQAVARATIEILEEYFGN